MMTIEGKHVLVVGLGKSGIAAARYAARHGAQVVATDHAAEHDLATAQAQLAGLPIVLHCSGMRAEDFSAADLVVMSPGVSLALPELAIARQRGIPVIGEMEFAVPHIRCPLIAVTGTNGKSTTTTLITQMVQAAGKRVVMGGNIGTPLLDLLGETPAADYVVLEVSSYQIEITPSLQPAITVLLNITPDHLDRYQSFEAYAAAKRGLIDRLTPQSTLIYNGCDPVVTAMAKASRAQGIAFCVNTPRWTFDAPALVGLHNRENLLAAAMTADLVGVPFATITQVARTFTGLPHRCQLVTEWNGIRFFDDSKATNIGSVERVVESFTEPIILIAGGQDKGTGYAALRRLIKSRVRLLILLGEAKHQMQQALGDCTETILVPRMQEAVTMAVQQARSGDVVLLAPACASFDQYRNYAERGDDFVHWVTQCTQHTLGATSHAR